MAPTLQFFITYRSCLHLNGKHTVFGQLRGGFDALKAIEAIDTDKDDRPKKEVKIKSIDIFKDPFVEYDESLVKAKEDADKARAEASQSQIRTFCPFLSKWRKTWI